MLPMPPESPRIRMPTHLGKYEITRVIGEGAMGTVYLALDPLLQRQVAVKAIRTQLLQDDADGISVAERFRIEAQAAGRLSHPGIVGVYEYGEEDGTAYIAMEYVRGHTLLQYLAHSEPLAEDDALSVAVQLLEALHHAHELGVWHRDIKPGNLIVTPDGSLKVTDFGIARFESATGFSRQQTLLLIGSPGYIAPERYTGELPDRRVDIFSCGAVIYQLLTGVPPFTGSASEVMYQVLHNEPAPPSVYGAGRAPLSASYDDVVLKALARHPQDRYATALEMRDALLSVARRPVSRRLQHRAMSRLPPLADGPSTPPRRSASNVFEMPTQRIRRALPRRESPRPLPTGAPHQEAAEAQTTRPSLWPPESLKAVEAALTERIGPIARVMVARAQAGCADVPALLQCLASQALTAGEQQTFITDARLRLARCGVSETRAAPVRPATTAAALPAGPGRSRVPVLHDAATVATLHPRTIALAEALLTAKIGPIASLLVKQALAVSTERTGFFLALAEPLRGCIDRDALLAVLQRLD